MKHLEATFLVRSRAAFLADPGPSLLHVRQQITAQWSGTARRDALSALDTVARVFNRDLSTIRAVPKTVRELLASRTACELGLSEKRYANVRSGIVSAMRNFAGAPAAISRRIPPSSAWKQLLDQIDNRVYRCALHRLSSYCSHMNVPPQQLRSELLLGLFEALEAEEAVRHPRKIIKHTIAIWNICHRTVPGWPDIRLGSPFPRDTVSLPLAAFPESFRRDLERWRSRVADPDVFDVSAPARPLRPSTVEGQVQRLVRFASALVRAGTMTADEVTGLDVLVDIERFKSGLRFFLERLDNQPTPYLHNLANTVRFVAIHHCGVGDAAKAELARICRRLDNPHPRQLTPRNRERLRQFDDPDKVARLLAFPQAERARGLAQKNALRAAKCFERALAVALLISCTLRMQNLRTIDLREDINRAGRKLYLSIDGARVKNGQPLEFELPDDVAGLLDEYVRDHRPNLSGAAGPYLFPGRCGGPRPHSTMMSDICNALRKRAGLTMNPHLFRHAIAKIVVERDPGLSLAMSRQLGHKRIDTTMAHYLGTETRASGRQINRLLQAALAAPSLGQE